MAVRARISIDRRGSRRRPEVRADLCASALPTHEFAKDSLPHAGNLEATGRGSPQSMLIAISAYIGLARSDLKNGFRQVARPEETASYSLFGDDLNPSDLMFPSHRMSGLANRDLNTVSDGLDTD